MYGWSILSISIKLILIASSVWSENWSTENAIIDRRREGFKILSRNRTHYMLWGSQTMDFPCQSTTLCKISKTHPTVCNVNFWHDLKILVVLTSIVRLGSVKNMESISDLLLKLNWEMTTKRYGYVHTKLYQHVQNTDHWKRKRRLLSLQ